MRSSSATMNASTCSRLMLGSGGHAPGGQERGQHGPIVRVGPDRARGQVRRRQVETPRRQQYGKLSYARSG